MPCPLFLPFPQAPPIGEPFAGRCRANPAAELPFELLLCSCNPGYARGTCPLASGAREDSYRFLIQSHTNGVFRVAWSSERDHGPVEVGTLELRESDPADNPLEAQARAHIAEYLRRSGTVW